MRDARMRPADRCAVADRARHGHAQFLRRVPGAPRVRPRAHPPAAAANARLLLAHRAGANAPELSTHAAPRADAPRARHARGRCCSFICHLCHLYPAATRERPRLHSEAAARRVHVHPLQGGPRARGYHGDGVPHHRARHDARRGAEITPRSRDRARSDASHAAPTRARRRSRSYGASGRMSRRGCGSGRPCARCTAATSSDSSSSSLPRSMGRRSSSRRPPPRTRSRRRRWSSLCRPTWSRQSHRPNEASTARDARIARSEGKARRKRARRATAPVASATTAAMAARKSSAGTPK